MRQNNLQRTVSQFVTEALQALRARKWSPADVASRKCLLDFESSYSKGSYNLQTILPRWCCRVDNVLLQVVLLRIQQQYSQSNISEGLHTFNSPQTQLPVSKICSVKLVDSSNPKGPELANVDANIVKMVTKVAKNDCDLALSPRFRH
ncbi:hypothetical protein TNCV_2616451 [Trichonephila clavipes]|nr:hypothetical protein TNCV_2616451 [Trichonephila clavipes]